MADKKSDSRVNEIRDQWLLLYKEKYSLEPLWSGKNAALTKNTVIRFLDRNQLETQRAFDAMQNYLMTEDDFLSTNRHSFQLFCGKVESYFIEKKEKPVEAKPERHRPIPEAVAEVLKRRQKERVLPTDEAILSQITPDPVKFLKGLKTTYGLGKKINPQLAKKVLDLTVELVGKERAKKIWQETKKIAFL